MNKLRRALTILLVIIAASATVLAVLSQTAWAQTILAPHNEEAPTYNVTFDANGGTVRLTPQHT